MDNNFIRFLDAAEEIRQMQENREELKEKAKAAHDEAMEHINKTIETYRGGKRQYIDLMKKVEEENRDNEKRVVELTKQQIQAATAGKSFAMAEELARLKGEVATYPQTMEAFRSLADDIVIPAADVEAFEEYRQEWQGLSNDIKAIEHEMQIKLLEIQKNIIPFCMATFEVIPGNREFLPEEVAKEWEAMRKEPNNEE